MLVFFYRVFYIGSLVLNVSMHQTLQSQELTDLPKQLVFDADTTKLTKDGLIQVFEGDVVAVGSGVILNADSIRVDRKERVLVAKGHIIILTQSQVFTGDSLKYFMDSGDFYMEQAVLSINDKAKAEQIANKVLGFTPRELEFERNRSDQLNSIQARKDELRDIHYKSGVEEPSEDLVDRYKLLLEQETLMKSESNPYLTRLAQNQRDRYLKRRMLWEELKPTSQTQQAGYFRIEGKTLQRKNLNDFEAARSYWTPCKCEDDETPAWGIRSDSLKAQMEGYIDFYHPIIEVKGVPVLYLPYLKAPIKGQKQSGFLMPSFSFRRDAGNIFSQPLYLALGDSQDATLTTEIYEKRGTKLAAEYRFQQRRHSGWELGVEAIRDRQWTDARQKRDTAKERFMADDGAGLRQYCEQSVDANDFDQMQACLRGSRSLLTAPGNTWRGARRWRGMSILSERISFVSHGDLYSDHRYVEDLTLYEDFQNALEGNSRAHYFSTAKHQLHYDGSNIYAGAGGKFADNVLTESSFQGQQMPFHSHIQSRLFNVGTKTVPVYFRSGFEHIQIKDFIGEETESLRTSGENRSLGQGYWQRYSLVQTSPIISRGIVKLDQFSDVDMRRIAHSKLEKEESSIRSYRFGLRLNLPIDGDMPIAEGLLGEKRFLRHYMNWGLTFSVRPGVDRSGPYARFRNLRRQVGDEEGGELVFRASDRMEYAASENDIPLTETMTPHRNIRLSTSHTWDIFNLNWKKIPAKNSTKERSKQSLHDQALQELRFSGQIRRRSLEDIYDFSKDEWSIDRYTLEESDHKRFLSFDSAVSYDFIQAEKREAIGKKVQSGESGPVPETRMPQPWTPIYANAQLNVFSVTARNTTVYNIYYRKAVEQNFILYLPPVLQTGTYVGYNISEDPVETEDLEIIFKRREELYYGLQSSFFRNIGISGWYGKRSSRLPDGGPVEQQYQTIFGLQYLSPSDCWRLAVNRQKRYDYDEKKAEYLLQLSVVFLGSERSRDLSPSVVRYIPGRDE
jgi:lipopolysaccharide export system protein LptA